MPDAPIPFLLTLAVPCYNESGRLELLFGGLARFLERWPGRVEIILVNDGSLDATEAGLKERAARLSGAEVQVVSQQNTGKGGALRNGVLRSSGDFILTLDADMASRPDELLRWMQLLPDGFRDDTIYVASREHPDSVIKKQGDRKVAGNIFNVIVRMLTPLRISDTQCGFKLYPGAAGRRLFLDLQTFGWAHDVELLLQASRDGMQIREMPVEWNAVEGSKIRLLRDGVSMLFEVIGILAKTKKKKSATYTANREHHVQQ